MNSQPIAPAARYEAKPRKVWAKKAENLPGPARVSPFSLPSNPENYELIQEGWTIRDHRTNTDSNYFFGKVGIDSEEEAREIIARLINR